MSLGSGLWASADADPARRSDAFFQPQAERWHLKKFEAWTSFYNRFYKAGHFGKDAPRQCDPRLATAAAEIVKVRNLEIGILPLNTAWFAQADDDSGKLFVGEPLLRAAISQVQKAKIKIALMHHPVQDLSEVERRNIEQLLQEHCHFVLRGHLHENEAQWVSSPYRQTLVMAAGAAYQGASCIKIARCSAKSTSIPLERPRKCDRIRSVMS